MNAPSATRPGTPVTPADVEQAYGAEHADVYDAIYRGRGRDYAAEAADFLAVLRTRRPEVTSLLDVACGTGAHLAALRASVDHVEGVELSPWMHTLATRQLPGVAVHQDDMRSFNLSRRFSAVTCLFSSVGYLKSVEDLRRTLRTFRAHTAPGGVALVEPWWFPETFLDGYVGSSLVEVDGRTIARVSHTVRAGNTSRMTVEYTVAEPVNGLRRFSDLHVLSLFTREQYEDAFEQAGFAVEFLKDGPSGRGLFLGVAPESTDGGTR
ncbi:class I SAM-dependent DNA methyltransferase [Streptomyces sp. NPDC020412]|uniref:class I SAM-dependent DNA methyltransferase n=1 Tax=Streptomyces sp. NPDC020412 TaxID=3365073 RepID=UPI0037A22DF9